MCKKTIGKKMKYLILVITCLMSFTALSANLVSDETTQPVTDCGIVIDSNAKVKSPVVTSPTGKKCSYNVDVFKADGKQHTASATFIDSTGKWQESPPSATINFTVPGIFTAPGGLRIEN
jgi:hypothetical protein